MAAVVILVFALGCLAGSFVTAIAHRLPRGERLVTGRSRCPSCGATVRARDSVAVVSWLALRGRCRQCGEPIGLRYPLAEAGLGLLYAITYLVLGDEPGELVLGLALCTVLVAVTLTDLDLRLIPNTIVAAGSVTAVAIVAVIDIDRLPEHLLSAAIAGGLLFLVVLAYPRGMGMGDAKLVAMMGLYLGRAVAPAVLIGLAVGALVGIWIIARGGAAARRQAIPFGPFLAFGGIAALWAGDEIVDWYTDSFFSSA